MNYKVSDFVIRLKNAAMAKRREVVLPYSRLNHDIGKVLIKKRFLDDLKEDVVNEKKVLVVKINYENRSPVLTNVSIISKPSLRVYIGVSDIAKIERKRLSTVVISTSKGIMSGEEARKEGIGGEALFEIW